MSCKHISSFYSVYTHVISANNKTGALERESYSFDNELFTDICMTSPARHDVVRRPKKGPVVYLFNVPRTIPAQIDLLHKFHEAPIPYPTTHHFVAEMCTCVHISVAKWCIVGYLSNALWVLWDGSIALPDHRCGLFHTHRKAPLKAPAYLSVDAPAVSVTSHSLEIPLRSARASPLLKYTFSIFHNEW